MPILNVLLAMLFHMTLYLLMGFSRMESKLGSLEDRLCDECGGRAAQAAVPSERETYGSLHSCSEMV